MLPLLPPARFITDLLRRRLDPAVGAPEEALDHPDLRRMSPRELADLPLPRPVLPRADALGEGHDLAA